MRVVRAAVVVLGTATSTTTGDLQQHRGRLGRRQALTAGARRAAPVSPAARALPVVSRGRRAALTVGRGEVVQTVRVGKRQLLVLLAVEQRREALHAGGSVTAERGGVHMRCHSRGLCVLVTRMGGKVSLCVGAVRRLNFSFTRLEIRIFEIEGVLQAGTLVTEGADYGQPIG